MNLFISLYNENVEVVLFSDIIIKKFLRVSKNAHTTHLYDILSKIELDEIKNIYFINGPGSFTGLRVGMIYIKSIAMKIKCDIYILDTMSYLTIANNNKIALNARGNKYFILKDNKIICVSDVGNDYLVDPKLVDFEISFCEKFKKVDMVEINYVKSPI